MDPKNFKPDWGNGKYVFELFPPEMIALNAELCTSYHPKLQQIIGQYPADETDLKIAHIAIYCGVILDDVYTLDDKIKLCKILTEKLYFLRETPQSTEILLPP